MNEIQDIESLRTEVKALRSEVRDLKEFIRAVYSLINEEEEDYLCGDSPGDAEIGRYNT
jgi:hypothetical protein